MNITREEVQSTMMSSVKEARDYLCQLNPEIISEKLDVKFSVIIEKPSFEQVLSYLHTLSILQYFMNRDFLFPY